MRVDDDEAVGLRGGKGEKARTDSLVEGQIETELESRLVGRGLAGESEGGRQVEEDRERWPEPAGRDALKIPQRVERHAGPIALVGERRIGVASGDDRSATGERRPDEGLHELPPSRAEQQRIRERVDQPTLVPRREEHPPDLLPERCPAGLTRPDDVDAISAKVVLETPRLRRLARPFRALDRDEPGAGRRSRLDCHAVESIGRGLRRDVGRAADPSVPVPRTLGVMGRRLLRAAALAALLAGVPSVVLAHPLGNFTINHYAGITVTSDEIRIDVVVDRAEIPTFQERRHIDSDEDGQVSDDEATAAAGPACAGLQRSLRLELDGTPAELSSRVASLTFPSGLGGLPTMRVECSFAAPLALHADDATTIRFADESDPERVGWREIVVVGEGATVDAGDVPATSISRRLTAYPDDLLSQPLDIRSATIVATAEAGAAAGTQGPPEPAAESTVGAVPGGVVGELPAIFNSADLTPWVLIASLALAAVLGVQHALTPGHGKTLMAAYLVGSRGRPAHAVGLGLTVSVSHTTGILVLTAIVVGAQGVLPADAVVKAAPGVAAVTIVAVGAWMLAAEVRRRRPGARATDHDHDQAHRGHRHEGEPASPHASELDHEHEHEHSHGGARHSHLPPAGGALSWRGLFALGLVGGLIPSTSALLILLSSIVAGRPVFGFVLVVAFGLGMAAVMAAIGLAVVYGRSRIESASASPRLRRLAAAAPLGAAVVVLAVGLVLTVEAVGGSLLL